MNTIEINPFETDINQPAIDEIYLFRAEKRACQCVLSKFAYLRLATNQPAITGIYLFRAEKRA
ncbi:MAG: hypothetical protein Satyrvirus10_18 [Satyrvirus sp.]|uniref:Uncharacterized protein n=1 Tax=Satyrvirus sp. TaxID=2487771 RepID=A0A3G5ADR4_9VIRU|nr:MAG: hypothetical protein Satyrvirus10_18 [Satyrvirus sp.]